MSKLSKFLNRLCIVLGAINLALYFKDWRWFNLVSGLFSLITGLVLMSLEE